MIQFHKNTQTEEWTEGQTEPNLQGPSAYHQGSENIYRIQPYDSIMCGYFCIRFIDFMLKGKSLLDYTNLFSPNDYEKNDKITLKYFQYYLWQIQEI